MLEEGVEAMRYLTCQESDKTRKSFSKMERSKNQRFFVENCSIKPKNH